MTRSERFKAHVDQWKDCTLCPLCTHRKRTVFSRGRIPANILFIGEAPGPSEDSIGRPFVGTAGHILDLIIQKASERFLQAGEDTGETRRVPSYCVTNSVLCFPGRNPKGKIIAPKAVEVKACNPRLVEFVKLVEPKLIIRLGNVAKSATKELADDYEIRSMIHPAAIAYMDADPQMQHLQVERCVHRLSDWMSLCT